MRPTFTTGEAAANVITTAICKNTRKKSRMLLAPCSAKLSAQSPPCSRKASPAPTRASAFLRLRASPAKTSGGKLASCASTSASACVSGYSGICTTGLERQLSGVQRSDMELTPEQNPRDSRRLRAPPYTQAVARPLPSISHSRTNPCSKNRILVGHRRGHQDDIILSEVQ